MLLTQDEIDRALAEAHWKWLETVLRKLYVDAMIHGIKHGRQEKENDENSKVHK